MHRLRTILAILIIVTAMAPVSDFPLTAPLGELHQYSNQTFAIGGYAASVAPGGSPDDLDNVLADGNYAVSHGLTITGEVQATPLEDEAPFVHAVAPAGALWSSATEMARYLQTELAGGLAPDGEEHVFTFIGAAESEATPAA